MEEINRYYGFAILFFSLYVIWLAGIFEISNVVGFNFLITLCLSVLPPLILGLFLIF